MAFLDIKNVQIKGIAACIPARVEENKDYTLLNEDEIKKYIEATGVERRHCAIHDGSICTSDLCQKAAEKLLTDLQWKKEEVDLLVFVSQTTDYRLPATACVLQDKMGLPTSCLAYDITLGCSGFILGLGNIASVMAGGNIRKALLMVGNTQSEFANYEDKSMYLLLGDAGTVTALEYDENAGVTMHFNYMTNGSGRRSVIVPDGGSRNPVSPKSFELETYPDGAKRTRLNERMDGADVFSFGIKNVPKNFKSLIERNNIDQEKIDYYLIHQASKFLFEKLRKKIKAPVNKTPTNLKEYGNTSGATIPLLMVTELQDELQKRELELCMTAIGVGYSVASGYIKTKEMVCSDLMYL